MTIGPKPFRNMEKKASWRLLPKPATFGNTQNQASQYFENKAFS